MADRSLQGGDSKDAASACARELQTNQLLKAWKEDELSRLGAEEKAHAQAAEQAEEDLKSVHTAADALNERKKVRHLLRESSRHTAGNRTRKSDRPEDALLAWLGPEYIYSALHCCFCVSCGRTP